MWTKDSLHDLITKQLGDHELIVVANREPYLHRYASGRLECVPPASGMVSALDPLLRACGGVWVAHGSGSADRRTVDARDRIRVPPGDPSYTLRRVWLTKEQEDFYYYGLSNSGLWPLCHNVFTRPEFDARHWAAYREVNELFARAVVEEAGDAPAFIFVQDYHFALLPRILKEMNPKLTVAQFWHIPWPNPEVFQVFPWKEELLEGLLGNDLLGFHLRYHCKNFLDTVDRTIEAKVDYERFDAVCGGKTTAVRPFPIGIDFEGHSAAANEPDVEEAKGHWREKLQLDGLLVGLGIDRIDYTKGIPERLRALDRLFEKQPEYRERLTFVQIGVPSRTHIHQYQQLDAEIDALVETINWNWSTDSWRPIVYLKQQYGFRDMSALHQIANFCVVSSLDDGMNLVAKEFVASRVDEDGVLILSRFTGAARELTQAVLVNPFAVDELADAMHLALTMPPDERSRRMQRMRVTAAENNIYRWAGKFLSVLLSFELPDDAPVAHELVLQ
jgi:alpha,alpha-trehalose-phosphate synthase [UDP-forming]